MTDAKRTAPVTRFYERGPEVDAIQHDGTEEKGKEILEWLRDPRVEANLVDKGSFNNDRDNAYIAIGTTWGVNYAGPGDWIVRDANRQLSIHANTAFKLRFMALTGVV